LLAAAVACGLGVLAPAPAATVDVVVASRPLDAGTVLGDRDVKLARRPAGTNPGALTSPGDAVGRVLAAPVGAAEALTPERLVGPGLASRLSAHGHVAAPVRLADTGAATLLRAGDLVDVVLASGDTTDRPQSSVVAPGARVVAVVTPKDDAVLGTASGSLVVLDVPRDRGLALARAASLGPLSVLLEG
jgi:Flp pilus assembly protein CpaB